MSKSTEVKERIIEATISLINESEGDVANISTRAIAERASVGVGMVNYHFQTKDHLIDICVERIIGDVISAFRPEVPGYTPLEQARHTAKLVADFLFSSPAVSRISILSDFKHPKPFDNTMKSVMGMEYTLVGQAVSEQKRHMMAFALVSVMQALFLRQEFLGCDMKVKEQRDEMLDLLMDCLFQKEEAS